MMSPEVWDWIAAVQTSSALIPWAPIQERHVLHFPWSNPAEATGNSHLQEFNHIPLVGGPVSGGGGWFLSACAIKKGIITFLISEL